MNGPIAKFRALTVISVFITMASGCAHETNSDMDGLMISIRAEYAAVAPSLLETARELVAYYTESVGRRYEGKPFIETAISLPGTYAEGETNFTVWAVECIMSYGPPEIGRIDKHLSLKVPFTATVYVPVTMSYRRSEKLEYLYIGPGRFFSTGTGYGSALPIPYGLHSLPKEYPPEVHRLAEKAKALCLRADQTTDPTRTVVVRYEYRADKAEWVPEHRKPPGWAIP